MDETAERFESMGKVSPKPDDTVMTPEGTPCEIMRAGVSTLSLKAVYEGAAEISAGI